MAVTGEYVPINDFPDWYIEYKGGTGRNGELEYRGMAPVADHCWHQWQHYKREMDMRVANY